MVWPSLQTSVYTFFNQLQPNETAGSPRYSWVPVPMPRQCCLPFRLGRGVQVAGESHQWKSRPIFTCHRQGEGFFSSQIGYIEIQIDRIDLINTSSAVTRNKKSCRLVLIEFWQKFFKMFDISAKNFLGDFLKFLPVSSVGQWNLMEQTRLTQ